jgi:DNA-binding IclR family transcriptional regulator
MSRIKVKEKPRYSVPALEKGLDVLELLAGVEEGMTLTQIARALERSPDELFRPVVCLEQRGYLYKMKPGDVYYLTPRMFVLSHQHPPTRRLLDAALPRMRDLSARCRQSCHLSVPCRTGMLVVAQTDAPESLGFAVRTGTILEWEDTSTGTVWRVFSGTLKREDMPPDLRRLLSRGYLQRASPRVKGLTDLCVPILDHRGLALAVLSVPYLAFRSQPVSKNDVLAALRETAALLSESQGYPPSSAS